MDPLSRHRRELTGRPGARDKIRKDICRRSSRTVFTFRPLGLGHEVTEKLRTSYWFV